MSEPPIETWADPIAAAHAAATSLLQAIHRQDDLTTAIDSLRRRNDQALMLALAAAAAESMPEPVVRRFRDALEDWSWLQRLALDHITASSFGVVSLGTMTRFFLAEVADLAATVPEVHTSSRAVARGLGYLGLPIVLNDPARAATLVVPTVARHRDRVWTTAAAASALGATDGRHPRPAVLCHPLASLSSRNRLAYRPNPIVIDVKLTSGVKT